MRERILTEAARLFAHRGYAGTTVQAVADAVGVTKPSVIYWYPSKKALRDAVVDQMLLRWRELLPRLLQVASEGEDRLDAVLGEVVHFFAEDPDRARLLNRIAVDQPEETRDRLQGHLRPWLALLAGYIREAQRDGRARPEIDPDAWVIEVVVLLIASFSTLEVSTGVLGGDPEDARERLVASLVRMVKASLYRDPPPSPPLPLENP
jgi:AcrR family transcriptional regulator